ncbi:hypothetical protein OBV_36910 [Oscillibacter valericigenes Sjm18-20]|nr:hypothetical protein OBV_36910 [Oscillibacter valericigenes Sjm18-20]
MHKKHFTEFSPAFQVELYTERIFKTSHISETAKAFRLCFVFVSKTYVAIFNNMPYICFSVKDILF